MSHDTVNRSGKRGAARLRSLLHRAASYRRHAKRALTLALVTAGMAAAPSLALAQMGQTAMTPSGGIVNRAVSGFQNLNATGPGWLYYGINAADRGLGYRGSYMTLGGFIPVAEDDLGGFWAADLRGHLSEYGGFFSNVGAVRKQFIGGTLLGVGVYWDYDGDQNQYSDTVIPVGLGNTYTFAGGHSYNQVGVSGEWLTDWGNLRSNGYIPVGSTAQLVGPFLGNSLLCVNGINAALGGADLEVGAYIPGLSDWAGMISVGGYALGNTRYSFPDGAAAVPWFGGVYTRLDMTFVNNWDFSLQANNDSYFDWTGFARLTYRMGASRRRNVPDQMEQPMMRNEHIVRAHQTPEVAINPETGTAWQVFHVDNTANSGGNGSSESPFATLEEAVTRPTNDPYDIVYVHQGTSSATTPYFTPAAGFTFVAANQYLIGEGSTLAIPTVSCGDRSFFNSQNNSLYPVIQNPIGPAIVTAQPGVVVSHFQITGSPIGISDGPGVAAPGTVTVSDVNISGGAGFPQRGVDISNSTGTFNFDAIRLQDMSNDGFVMTSGAKATVTKSNITDTVGTAVRIAGAGAEVQIDTTKIADTVGTAVIATGANADITLTSSTITRTTGNAVVAAGSATRIVASDFAITGTSASALVASGANATIVARRGVVATTTNNAVVASGNDSVISIERTRVENAGLNGAVVSGLRAGLYLTDSSRIEDSGGSGIYVTGNDSTVLVQDSKITNSGNNGVEVSLSGGSATTQATILRSSIEQSIGYGVLATGVNGANDVVQIFGSNISGAGTGISAIDSNIDVGRDPTTPNGRVTSINNAGVVGIVADGQARARVVDSSISGVGVGISAGVNPGSSGGVTPASGTNLTATGNTISSGTVGIHIGGRAFVAGPPPVNQAETWAEILGNRITTSGSAGILLQTTNPTTPPPPGNVIHIRGAGSAAQLGAFNFGTTAVEDPEGQVDFNPTVGPPPLLPPQPTIPTPP